MSDDRDEMREDDAPAEPSAIETFLRPIAEEESLRPVIVAVLIGLSSVLGWGLLLAIRDRRPGAVICIVLLGLMSFETLLRARRSNRRFGIGGWSVIVLWIASTLFAIGGAWTGYL